VAADVNGDGKPDLICANSQGNTLSVLTNDGSGGFMTSGTYPAGNGPNSVVTADINGDGWLDLICANNGDATLSVLTNNGSGGFGSAGTYAVGSGPASVVAADVNGDGEPDLICANYNNVAGGNTLSVLTNATPFPLPPVITAQPQSLVVNASDTASFSVDVFGIPPFGYQWSLNGTNIMGATSSSLTISNVTQYDLGAYSVVVSNYLGATTSSNAMLSMYPTIMNPFTGAITYWGQSATLSMAAWGTGPLSYQWFDNGVAILNATNQTLNLSGIQSTNAGLYSVVVSSPLGSVTNAPEQVIVELAGVSLGFSPTLTISGVTGYSYIIQGSTNLGNANGWVTLTNLTLTQPVQLFIDTTVDASSPFNSQHFYRVLLGQ